MCAPEQAFPRLGARSDEQVVRVDAAAEVAVDQEAQAPEHALFADPRLVGNGAADPIGETSVEGHAQGRKGS